MLETPLLRAREAKAQGAKVVIWGAKKILAFAFILYCLSLFLPQIFLSPEVCKPKVTFDKTLGSNMVLQQAPARATVYGSIVGLGGCALDVALVDSSGIETSLPVDVSGTRWSAQLSPMGPGGSFKIVATAGASSASLSNVVFGDVWYCAGQSNMALPLENTMSRNSSLKAILSGKYNNIRVAQIAGNMNPEMPWKTIAQAVKEGEFMKFSSTCYYFGESLVDELGDRTPPIGLIHTAFGGSTIQQWLPNSTIFECGQVSNNQGRYGTFFDARILPYSRMSIKGWVWYQGENNMHDFFGNPINHTGYACLMVKLVDLWRNTWSSNSANSHHRAPFGIVALPNSGSEGGNSIGAMRIAQTGSFGFLPNREIPYSFLAQTYDLNDPFTNTSCYSLGCCAAHPAHKNCNGCDEYCESTSRTNFYIGPIHSRVKKPVGKRLALAYLGQTQRSSQRARSGPTFHGCRVTGPKEITVTFDNVCLGSDKLLVQKYGARSGSQFEVLVNQSAFCMQTIGRGGTRCLDDGAGFQKGPGHYDDERHTWVSVDISLSSSNTIAVDLSKTNGVAYAIRYGWGDCCHPRPPTSLPCPLEACPLMAKYARLPANPFIAKIVDGACECLPPLNCASTSELWESGLQV